MSFKSYLRKAISIMKPFSTTRLFILFSLAILVNTAGHTQSAAKKVNPDDVCLSPAEKSLATLINAYRREKKLPEIPVSRSLTYVAQIHVRDLMQYYRQNNRCNMHSWSDHGSWSSCCYTADHRKASCMWNKPRELTSYTGDGYEIAFYSNYPYSTPADFAMDILKGWKKSPAHNEIIINRNKWKTSDWKAMGVGVYGDYAVVWFGEEADVAGEPPVCAE
jgi:uncharacterized protein YkwD